MRTIPLFLILCLTLSCVSAGGLKLYYGTYVARSVNGAGSVSVRCYGGSGRYSFNYNGLPSGWRTSDSSIVIPNINALYGKNYIVNLEVRDLGTGEILNGNVNFLINGVRVDLSSAGPGSVINIGSSGSSVSTGSGSGSFGSGSFGSGTISFTTTGGSVPTGSGPGSGSSPLSSQDLAALYSSYPGLTINGPGQTNPNQFTNPISFPQPVGPPSTPNPAPQIIANAQAPFVPSRDTNPITVDIVKRNAVFNRQINANKAVANLIAIVQRLTANVNAARSDITTLTNALQQAENAYNTCSQEIFGFANTRAKIENAIADKEGTLLRAQESITQAQGILAGLKGDLNRLIVQRNQIESQKSPNSAKVSSLQIELRQCFEDRENVEREIQDLNTQIGSLNVDIRNTKDEASAAPGRIAQIDRQVPIVDRKIADLRRQLADAEDEKLGLARDRKMYQDMIDKAATEVARLEKNIAGLRSRIPGLQSRIASITRSCERIQGQLDTYRNNLGKIESSFRTLLQEITAQQGLIDSQQAQINRIRSTIGDLPNEIRLLRAELERVDAALRRQSFLCDSAADEVRKAKQNAEAMRLKLERESQLLSQANFNLQAARSEKELADVAVEELLQVYTDALPFAIVPNGGGLTNPGFPAGNNPSGSPLGPVPTGFGVDPSQSILIGDLNTYLSSAYGANVDPARPSTVTSLYPLSTRTLSTLVNQSTSGIVYPPTGSIQSSNLYNFQCNGGNQVTGSGQIYSVQPGMIQVRTQNQGIVNMQLAGCSSLESVRPNHSLSLNDNVYFRGANVGGGNVHLNSMTCL